MRLLPASPFLRRFLFALLFFFLGALLVGFMPLALSSSKLRATIQRLSESRAESARLRAALDDRATVLDALKTALDDRETLLADAIRDRATLSATASRAIDLAQTCADELSRVESRLYYASKPDREAALRRHLRQRLDDARSALPAPPDISDAPPGQGIGGHRYLFPLLLAPDGKTLRENAEIVAVAPDRISVRFPGGTDSYAPSELHPGIVAFFPSVDPLLTLPRNRWRPELDRLLATTADSRAALLLSLRTALSNSAPPATPWLHTPTLSAQ